MRSLPVCPEQQTDNYGLVSVFLAPVFLLIISIIPLTACSFHEDEHDNERLRASLQSSADDLANLGFFHQAMALQEKARLLSDDLTGTFRAIEFCEKAGGPGAAACFLERLNSSRKSGSIEDLIIDLNLKNWAWEKAKSLLNNRVNDPRLAIVEDILNRARTLREPFNRTLSLSWRISGWTATDHESCYLLSFKECAINKASDPGVYCPVGWNGRGFRQSMDIMIKRISQEARLIWGLSSGPAVRSLFKDTQSSSILINYIDGEISIGSGGPCEGDALYSRKKLRLPVGVWLRITVEYLPENSQLFTKSIDGIGAIRAWVDQIDSNRRLVILEIEPSPVFKEGPMLAGFFGPKPNKSEAEECSLFVDNFVFDN